MGEIIAGSAAGPEGLTVLTKNGRLVQHPPDLSEPAVLHLGQACGTSTLSLAPSSLQRIRDGWVVNLSNTQHAEKDAVAVVRPAQLRARPSCVLISSPMAAWLSSIPEREDRGALILEDGAKLVGLSDGGWLGAHQSFGLPTPRSTLVDEDGALWTLTASQLQRHASLPRPEVAP
jgi:hypothetical protein